MKKNFTLLAIVTSVITVISGCSSEHFERATTASSNSGTTSEINLELDISMPQSSAIKEEGFETPYADDEQKEVSSEIPSSKEDAISTPEVVEDEKTESDTISVSEVNSDNPDVSEQGNSDNGNETQKPATESKSESEAPSKLHSVPETQPQTAPKPQVVPEDKPQTTSKPQAVPETKPQVVPEIKPSGISESDIAGFYPDNFNCKELTIGETHKPSAAIWLNNGKGKVYSSDESVAVVSVSGIVTAKGKGTAYIKIVTSTGTSKIYRYTVNECGISEDDILGFYPDDFNTFELAVGETHKPLASIWLADGNSKVYSYDESVVTVNASGVVTAIGEGVAYIKIIGSTGMSEMYMYVVDSVSSPQEDFEALFSNSKSR